jgi:2,4'-dihydroxyacetophenone dioxygenase
MNAPFHALSSFLPAQVSAAAELPWVPSGTPGKSAKLLRFLPDDSGFVELLRMEPGVVMPLHRHTGEIHAYNLSGSRQLCTGEIVGAGDYVYEPNGNTDWWKIVGQEAMLALVVVIGKVEFLDAQGRVISTANAASQRAELEGYCSRMGLLMPDLNS